MKADVLINAREESFSDDGTIWDISLVRQSMFLVIAILRFT